ncbi:MAG: radical SAM protein [Deltaproteobacteria bacterium]|nr:radical SAM protein [Deltaproteobacteria bacterium]
MWPDETRLTGSGAAFSHCALNTTVRCQHRCVYCFEGDRTGHEDLSCDQAIGLIEQASSKVRHVIFMGAEPTLNPDLPELIRHATGLGMRASVSTNAVRLADADYLRSLHHAGLASIELSMPYPDEQVYAAVTAARPQGFGRLLKALENIEALNRSIPTDLEVNVNIVVTRFNVHRLREAVAHVESRFTRTRYGFTLKRVAKSPDLSDEAFFRDIYVPCSELRAELAGFASALPDGAAARYCGFPLCALVGQECRDHDLLYWLSGAVVWQNFSDQFRSAPMYPEESLREPHRFQWICDGCTLDRICLQRALFARSRAIAADRPIASHEPIPRPLLDLVASYERGRTALGEQRVPQEPLCAWLLTALERASGPDRRIDGTDASWEPVETSVVALRQGERIARLRIRPLTEHPASLWTAGAWAVEPVEWQSGAAPPAALPFFLQLLRTLPPAPALGQRAGVVAEELPAHAALPPTVEGIRFGSIPPEPSQPDAVRAAREVWEAFLRDVALEQVQRALRDRTGGSLAQVEAVADGFVLRLPDQEQGVPVTISPCDGPASYGFLCGRVRLGVAADALEDKRVSVGVAAIARACMILGEQGSWPDVWPQRKSDFLRHVWRVFGAGLLPRVGSQGSLSRGMVAPRKVSLGFTTWDQLRFELVLLPCALANLPFAANGSIALQYHVSHASAQHPLLTRIVQQYASMLRSARD